MADIIISALLAFVIITFTGINLLKAHPANAFTACPCTLFGSSTPTYGKYNDNATYTLGERFKPNEDGYIAGVKFYKDASMATAHTGSLWGPTGTLLASGTYQNETGSGWQSLIFASPVNVTANTTYTVSYTTPSAYIATGSYFTTTPVDNSTLTTLATNQSDDAGHTGNGVFGLGNNIYPTNSGNGSNYWADVIYFRQSDATTPTINSTSPGSSATDISIGNSISAQFNTALNENTITNDTVKLLDDKGAQVAATVSFNQTSYLLTITPSTQLTFNTKYTVFLMGGASGIHSLSGQAMASDTTWSFTTEATSPCPCTVYNGSSVNTTAVTANETAVTLGVNIKADTRGYVSGIRFYKQMESTAATHNVALYTDSGTLLASGSTTAETGSGWQTATFASPVYIDPGQTYRIAYTASDGQYIHSSDLTTDTGTYPIHILQDGSYYTYSANAFPSSKSLSNYNYWIDPVFTETANYTPQFDILAAQPNDHAYGVDTHKPISITFTQALDATTVAGAITLKTSSGSLIGGTTSIDAGTGDLVFTPTNQLAYNTSFTATIASSLKDVFGTSFSKPGYSLHFTTGIAANTSLTNGKGGPILVVTNTTDKFSTYTAEILRSEGINYFTAADISTLSASLLAQYKYMLLGSGSLDANQVQLLSDWVEKGGNLIAFKPDKKLAGLLGITDGGSTLTDGYLKIDASNAPGKGIVSDTIQYHTAADRYSLSGATAIATLYSDASAATLNPAVTLRTVGSGHAAAFTYDLPQSIVMLHQGNPSWANYDPSQLAGAPFRPDSLFHTPGQTDWLNTSKGAIPQADEQQRLLVNILNYMSNGSGPLPHYWYLPHGYKAALEMTSDDHGTHGRTADFFGMVSLLSAPGCSVADWTCPRVGSLTYVSGGPTAAQASAFKNNDFPLGVHVDTNCQTPTPANIQADFADQISTFTAAYPTTPAQHFGRIHCYIWEGWADVPKIDEQFGIRYTMEYEWYPQSWLGTNTGSLTGSYMTMRFADLDGTMIDVYNAPTDLDYENDPTNATVNADLASATGLSGFYGIFGTHYDYTNTYASLLLTAAAQYNVPIISAEQARIWKDAQSNSTFNITSSSSYQVCFTPAVAEGGEGAVAMIPAASSNGSLASLTVNGAPAPYTLSTIKGVNYAVFDATPGAYIATYGARSFSSNESGHNSSNISNTNANSAQGSQSNPYASIFTSDATNSQTAPTDSSTITSSITTDSSHTNSEMSTSEQQHVATKKNPKPATTPQVAIISGSIAGAAIVTGGSWWILGTMRRNKASQDEVL